MLRYVQFNCCILLYTGIHAFQVLAKVIHMPISIGYLLISYYIHLFVFHRKFEDYVTRAWSNGF